MSSANFGCSRNASKWSPETLLSFIQIYDELNNLPDGKDPRIDIDEDSIRRESI